VRTWGRTGQVDGLGGTWTEVVTDDNGYDDSVWLTTLIQTLKLNLGESPFFANYGIPAQQTIITQVHPDYYVAATQQQYDGYFGSLILARVPSSGNPSNPEYRINVITQQGSVLQGPIPT
jgi:hypothetical protein